MTEIAMQLGVGRSTLHRHIRAVGRESGTAFGAMMQALEDDMEAWLGVYRRLAVC